MTKIIFIFTSVFWIILCFCFFIQAPLEMSAILKHNYSFPILSMFVLSFFVPIIFYVIFVSNEYKKQNIKFNFRFYMDKIIFVLISILSIVEGLCVLFSVKDFSGEVPTISMAIASLLLIIKLFGLILFLMFLYVTERKLNFTFLFYLFFSALTIFAYYPANLILRFLVIIDK